MPANISIGIKLGIRAIGLQSPYLKGTASYNRLLGLVMSEKPETGVK
jgi:hypothetical protein